MAKITNYTTLISNIQSFFKRTDAVSQMDMFIAMAEADIWQSLKIRDMEARATALTSTTDRFLALPEGFIKMRRLQILVNDHYVDMNVRDPKSLNIQHSSGVPTLYTITSEIEFNRTSDKAYTIEMQYFRELEAISTANPANAVLTFHPMIYLAGCLFHAYSWAVMPDKAAYWKQIFITEVASANRKSRNGRYGPAPTMRINASFP